MEQPVPQITDEDVLRVAKREFKEHSALVISLLSEYGKESWEREATRVRMDILKLSEGDIEKFRYYLSLAKSDYRDIIAPAEYPNYLQSMDCSGHGQEKAIEIDWQEYLNWLDKLSS